MIVDRNNAKYKFVDKKHGTEAMFCILIDNQEEDLRYTEKKGISNISEFSDLVSRHRGFIWPNIQDKIFIQKNSGVRKGNNLKRGNCRKR